MASLPRALAGLLAAATVALAVTLAEPEPPSAEANVACDLGVAGSAPVTGAVGLGNPVGDVCDELADSAVGAALEPLKDAAGSIGKGVFGEITRWAADGAVWLLGEVVKLTNETTTPDLLGKGFLRQYRQMAEIAAVMALAMLLLAVFEALGGGQPGMLLRVFLFNLPLAALATSAAYVVVQLLVATTDGFSELIAHGAAEDTRHFFKGAIEALGEAGGDLGGAAAGASGHGEAGGKAAGTVAAPLFVGFIAAILAAVAAFGVWIELLMRAAAIYAVALFMPLALAASIWPRWSGALRRTAELIAVVVFSKFVIVAIIALAASLLANSDGEIEHVLSAGALLLLACFSPLALFRLVPFAEGAVGSALNRPSPKGTGMRALHSASSSAQTMRRSALSNWGEIGGAKGGGARSTDSGRGLGSAKTGGGSAAASGGAASAGGAAALPFSAALSASQASKGAGEKLGQTATAQLGSESGEQRSGAQRPRGAGSEGTATAASQGKQSPPRAKGESSAAPGGQSGRRKASPSPEPKSASGGEASVGDQKPPRPPGGAGVASGAGKESGASK
jgi:type IV secretion system protein TrbL